MLLQAMPYPAQVGGVITFVGSYATGFTGDGGTVNFSSLQNSAGATPTLAQGDVVIATVGRLNQSSFTMSASDLYPSGYTAIRTDFTTGSTAGGGVSYKVMGATPDTSLAISNTGTGGSFGTASVSIIVLRGVDPSSPIDAAVAASTTASGPPNAPSVTPSVTGGIVFASGFATTTNNAVVTDLTRPSNLSSATNTYRSFRANVGGGSIQAVTGAGFASWTAGSFDPDAFGGDALWGAGRGYTLSFRPYGPSVFTATINTATAPLSITIGGSPVGSATGYQWHRDGADISGATASTYEVQEADFGTDLTVSVTYTNGIYTKTETSAAVSVSGGDLTQENGDALYLEGGIDKLLWFEVS